MLLSRTQPLSLSRFYNTKIHLSSSTIFDNLITRDHHPPPNQWLDNCHSQSPSSTIHDLNSTFDIAWTTSVGARRVVGHFSQVPSKDGKRLWHPQTHGLRRHGGQDKSSQCPLVDIVYPLCRTLCDGRVEAEKSVTGVYPFLHPFPPFPSTFTLLDHVHSCSAFLETLTHQISFFFSHVTLTTRAVALAVFKLFGTMTNGTNLVHNTVCAPLLRIFWPSYFMVAGGSADN